jgi:hypothetical protein
MSVEKENKNLEDSAEKAPISTKLKILKYVIYSSYAFSIVLLLSILLAIISNRKTKPFYSWIENSRFETYGDFVAGLIIEQKVSMQVSAQNDPLTEEENKLLEDKFKKISASSKNRLLHADLEPRDKRFLLLHPNLIPSIQGDYLLLSDKQSDEANRFGSTLDKLFVDFIMTMRDSDLSDRLESRPQICFYHNRSEYIKATMTKEKGFHDSLGFFSPVQNRIYFFSRKDSLEGLETLDKYDTHRENGRKLYKGKQLEEYLIALNKEEAKYLDSLDEETLCTLRHEGTHQLAHMYGLHSQRGFEKRWLTEGLAQYFETAHPGESRIQKKNMLIQNYDEGKLVKWETLINTDDGTFLKTSNLRRQLAYSQSWLVVRYLMKNYRKEFFKFIKMKKESGILDDPLKDFDKLCNQLKVSKQDFIEAIQLELFSL